MDHARYTPSEGKHLLPLDQLLSALRGDAFAATDWFRMATAIELSHTEVFDNAIKNLIDELEVNSWKDQQYLLVIDARILLPDGKTWLSLQDEKNHYSTIGLIAIGSVFPDILLSDVRLANWYFGFAEIQSTVRIEKGSQLGVLQFSHATQCNQMEIEDHVAIDDLLVKENSHVGPIFIHDHSSVKNISITLGSTIMLTLTIYDHSACEKIEVMEAECPEIEISDQSSCGTIKIWENSHTHGISVIDNARVDRILLFSRVTEIALENNCEVNSIQGARAGKLYIENCKVGRIKISEGLCNDLQFHNSEIGSLFVSKTHCKFFISNTAIWTSRLNECTIHLLYWTGDIKGAFYISGGMINYLQLKRATLSKESLIAINHTKMHVLELRGAWLDGQLRLLNISPAQEVFIQTAEWGNDGEPCFSESLERRREEFKNSTVPLLRMVDSSLGRAEIIASDLRSFYIEYKSTTFQDITLSGTQLPKDQLNIFQRPAETLSSKETYAQKASYYIQVKRIFENYGDVVQASWFQSKAMDSQEQLLKLAYASTAYLRKFWPSAWFTDEGFDLFNFRLNKYSSNHGESWRKAIRFILLLSIIFYTLYYISVNHNRPFSWKGAPAFIGDYWQFLDFTHRIDFLVDKARLSPLSKFLDFFGRIVLGYGIYQFIAAFRRHGRRTV